MSIVSSTIDCQADQETHFSFCEKEIQKHQDDIITSAHNLSLDDVKQRATPRRERKGQRKRHLPSWIQNFHPTWVQNSWIVMTGSILSAILVLSYTISMLNFPPSNEMIIHLSNHTLMMQSRPTLSFQRRKETFSTATTTTTSLNAQEWLYEFKILQITDIHLGEAEDQDWGPKQDQATFQALKAILQAELVTSASSSRTSPGIDLIVLGGDQLTANNCQYNATAYYEQLGQFLQPYGIPWVMIFGNHDDADYKDHTTKKRYPPTFSRHDLLNVDQQFPLSLSQAGPAHIDGVSNYMVNVSFDDPSSYTSDSIKQNSVALQILLLDSGGGSIVQSISESQSKWIQNEISKMPHNIPAIAFQHIPTQAHAYYSEVGMKTCRGLHEDNGFDPLHYDAGIVSLLEESGRFLFLAAGHDHGMGYCCPSDRYDETSNLHLCFGRHSGYGGYGHWERGCRVYSIQYYKKKQNENYMNNNDESQDENSTGSVFPSLSMTWSSWVRLESGEIVDMYEP